MQDARSYNNGDLITVPFQRSPLKKRLVSITSLVFVYCQPVLDHIPLEKKKYFD